MQYRHKANQMNKVDEEMGSSAHDRMSTKRRKQISANQKWLLAAMIEVCILLMMGFAWYTYLAHRKVLSEEREVMAPYYLYLVEPNGKDEFQLTVGNLHPGETKQIMLGVTNQPPEGETETSYQISKNSKFHYELELAYTQNLPVEYKVYELAEASENTPNDSTITVEWKDTDNSVITKSFAKDTQLTKNAKSDTLTLENNKEMYGEDNPVNVGQYDLYDNVSGIPFDLTTKVEDNNVTFDLDYYLIEIDWKDNIQFSDYLKETDLVYVIVNAMQIEPEKSAGE